VPPTSIEAPEIEGLSRVAEVRRRIRDRYYDRPEVRRALTQLLLRRLARESAGGSRTRPESA
jgi:hypothetical protein